MNERVDNQSIARSESDDNASPRLEETRSDTAGFAPARRGKPMNSASDDLDRDAGVDLNNRPASEGIVEPPIAPALDDDGTPLPPLPDGGLARSMPAWLQPVPNGDEDSDSRSAAPEAANPRLETGARATGDHFPISGSDSAHLADEPIVLLEASDLPAWLRALDAPANAPASILPPPAVAGPTIILELFSPSVPTMRTAIPDSTAPNVLPDDGANIHSETEESAIDSPPPRQPEVDIRPSTEVHSSAAVALPEPGTAPAVLALESPPYVAPIEASRFALAQPSHLDSANPSEREADNQTPPVHAVAVAEREQSRSELGHAAPRGHDTVDPETRPSNPQRVVVAEPARPPEQNERMVFGPPSDPVGNDWAFSREAASSTADEREIWEVSEAADRQRSRILPALGAVVLLFLIMMLLAYAGFTFR